MRARARVCVLCVSVVCVCVCVWFCERTLGADLLLLLLCSEGGVSRCMRVRLARGRRGVLPPLEDLLAELDDRGRQAELLRRVQRRRERCQVLVEDRSLDVVGDFEIGSGRPVRACAWECAWECEWVCACAANPVVTIVLTAVTPASLTIARGRLSCVCALYVCARASVGV